MDHRSGIWGVKSQIAGVVISAVRGRGGLVGALVNVACPCSWVVIVIRPLEQGHRGDDGHVWVRVESQKAPTPFSALLDLSPRQSRIRSNSVC